MPSFTFRRPVVGVALCALLFFTPPSPISAAGRGAAPSPAKPETLRKAGTPLGLDLLPTWKEPESYSVELVMQSDGRAFTMRRFLDKGRIRSEISAEGRDMVLIELGDSLRTAYSLIPQQKTAMKQTSMMDELARQASGGGVEKELGRAGARVEFLGEEKLEAGPARKFRITFDQVPLIAWFDSASGAPLRMEGAIEGKKTVMEWRRLQVGSQPEKLFEVPRDYQVQDMDALMAKIEANGGLGSMAGLKGSMAGQGGKDGAAPSGTGITGKLGGMAKQAGQKMGSQFGGDLGGGLGASFGGPVGALAGRYVGGRVGGWLGRKMVGAVTPGP